MTRITGYHHLSFTVTDLERSVAWYQDVLGFSIDSEVERPDFRRVRLRHPEGPVTVTLTQHVAGSNDRFDERRTGLDHVAFAVPTLADVEAFERRFEERGVEHSDIRPIPGERSDGGVITLRDPDNIQLEVFAPGT
jgi:glyoxylase I family protein